MTLIDIASPVLANLLQLLMQYYEQLSLWTYKEVLALSLVFRGLIRTTPSGSTSFIQAIVR